MHWFLFISTSVAIVVSILSLFHVKIIFRHIDDLRQRHKLVPYMALMIAWGMLLMYGFTWLLWMLHLAGLPVKEFTTFIFDFFVM